MKTPTEWANKINEDILPALMEPIRVSDVENMVKQIQLDALKEGAKRAAKQLCEDGNPMVAKKHILNRAENWTEKDLS